MTKRRLWTWTVNVLVAALALGLGLWLSRRAPAPKPAVTPENFHCLEYAMTQQEAEAILGSPGPYHAKVTKGYFKRWESEGYSVTLEFFGVEGDGDVVDGSMTEIETGRTQTLPLQTGFFAGLHRQITGKP